jgi:hypothetical protein
VFYCDHLAKAMLGLEIAVAVDMREVYHGKPPVILEYKV